MVTAKDYEIKVGDNFDVKSDYTCLLYTSLYKMFGIDAELLIDHAWGYETCRMSDIKN